MSAIDEMFYEKHLRLGAIGRISLTSSIVINVTTYSHSLSPNKGCLFIWLANL